MLPSNIFYPRIWIRKKKRRLKNPSFLPLSAAPPFVHVTATRIVNDYAPKPRELDTTTNICAFLARSPKNSRSAITIEWLSTLAHIFVISCQRILEKDRIYRSNTNIILQINLLFKREKEKIESGY